MNFFAVLLDDATELTRWAHAVAAILWVGSAFALLKLDLALKPRATDPTPQTLFLHAGPGYRLTRATDADDSEKALNFKWETYATWASGFALLCMVFCAAPRLYLIDPALWNAAPWAAAAAAILPLAVSWLAYDFLCKKGGLCGDALLWALFIFCAFLALILTHVFAGRGAYPLIGAHLATIMTANIAHIIVPAQKRRLKALRAGLAGDEADLRRAGTRALHNQYLALPTIFFMLSGHAPLLFAGPHNGGAAIMFLAGFFLIRRVWLKNLRGLGVDWKLSAAATACLALAFALSWPARPPAERQASDASDAIAQALRPSGAQAQTVIDARCGPCHAARPQIDGLTHAAGGLDFSQAANVERHRDEILRAAVFSYAMPPPGAAPALDAADKNLLIRWAEGLD
ncbi:urate hydroxylase PuuD [Rhodoblastus sp.]|uniref:urate hydroxylase PuuD n=1 Tax=Rhodoblastus sp. TaxID=1962975 RepID=UPI003F981974